MGTVYFASADADLLRNVDSSGAFGFFTGGEDFLPGGEQSRHLFSVA